MRISPWLLAGALLITEPSSDAKEAEHFVVPMGMVEPNFSSRGPSNLFPMTKGVYSGLLMPTNTFVAEHSGSFRLTVFSDRCFSVRLNVAGNSTPTRGRFDRPSTAGFSVYRKVLDAKSDLCVLNLIRKNPAHDRIDLCRLTLGALRPASSTARLTL